MPCAVTEGNAMDNTDISVLELLVSDARHTDSELAVMLGISQEELRGRKEKLERDGVIIGYSAVVNTEKLENDSVSALIEVKAIPQRGCGFDEIAEQLYQFDEVKSCYLMSGAYDLMLIVEGKNINAVARFVSERLSILDNVQSCATHFILKRYKCSGRVFVKESSDTRLVVSP